MDRPSALLELPSHIWDVMAEHLSVLSVWDRCAACLACSRWAWIPLMRLNCRQVNRSTYLADFPCAITHNAGASCRFWGWWADGVLKELQGISVAVPAGRFLQQHADQSGGTRLLFQLSDEPSQWLQLLGRFLTTAAPPGVPLASFLRQPAAAAAAPADGGAVADTAAAQPGLWVTLPPDFRHSTIQPETSTAVSGFCVGHLPQVPDKSPGISICLLISGSSSACSYHFELPSAKLVLSGGRAGGAARADLQLEQIRPVLRQAADSDNA